MVFSLLDFPASITLQPIPDLMPRMEVCLNPGLFCLVLNTILRSVRQKTPSHYSLLQIPHWLRPLILTPSSHLVPPPRFHFFQSHTNITYVTAHRTCNLYSFHIWYSNAFTTFKTKPCPRQYLLQVQSATSLR